MILHRNPHISMTSLAFFFTANWGAPIAGWFVRDISEQNGWELGVTLFQEARCFPTISSHASIMMCGPCSNNKSPKNPKIQRWSLGRSQFFPDVCWTSGCPFSIIFHHFPKVQGLGQAVLLRLPARLPGRPLDDPLAASGDRRRHLEPAPGARLDPVADPEQPGDPGRGLGGWSLEFANFLGKEWRFFWDGERMGKI